MRAPTTGAVTPRRFESQLSAICDGVALISLAIPTTASTASIAFEFLSVQQQNKTRVYPVGRNATRLVTSIKQGTVTASLMLRKLSSYRRQNGLALAMREIGQIERTLFTLD